MNVFLFFGNFKDFFLISIVKDHRYVYFCISGNYILVEAEQKSLRKIKDYSKYANVAIEMGVGKKKNVKTLKAFAESGKVR